MFEQGRGGAVLPGESKRNRIRKEDLYQKFQEAGLPAPTMRMEMPLGKEPDFAQWFYDIVCTLRPQMQQLHLPIESLGSLDTLVNRLQAEVAGSKTVATWFASVAAWSRKA